MSAWTYWKYLNFCIWIPELDTKWYHNISHTCSEPLVVSFVRYLSSLTVWSRSGVKMIASSSPGASLETAGRSSSDGNWTGAHEVLFSWAADVQIARAHATSSTRCTLFTLLPIPTFRRSEGLLVTAPECHQCGGVLGTKGQSLQGTD
jgi:hypothetical protein